MLNGLAAIVVFGLTFALWGLYHKIFNVVYFNAPVALLREFVICFVIACAIIAGVTSPIRSFLHPDKTEKFCGVFFNTELLNGSEFDSSIIIRKSDQVKGGIQIEGIAYEIGENVRYSFTQDIPCPDSNTFTFEVYGRDSISGEYPINYTTKYTIKINSKKETLNVVEETDRTDVPAPFAGDYVGSDAWEKLLPERQAAENAAMEVAEQRRAAEESAREQAEAKREAEWLASIPNPWIEDYFDIYVSRPFAEEDVGAICHRFTIGMYNSTKFTITGDTVIGRYVYNDFSYVIPYPLGPDTSTTHMEAMFENETIAFDILGKTQDGRTIIEITDFPDPAYIGQFIEGEDLLPDAYPWDGTYVCEDDGDGGQMTITVQQIDELTLLVNLCHLHEDGHEEYLEKMPTFSTYGGGAFADEGDFAFVLLQDEITGEYSIVVQQTPVYPDINLGYNGNYIKQEADKSV